MITRDNFKNKNQYMKKSNRYIELSDVELLLSGIFDRHTSNEIAIGKKTK